MIDKLPERFVPHRRSTYRARWTLLQAPPAKGYVTNHGHLLFATHLGCEPFRALFLGKASDE